MYKLKHACLGEFEPRAKDITAKSVRSTNLKTKATGIYALIGIGLETIDEHDSSVASIILGTVDRGPYVELALNVYDGCDLLQWVEYFTTEAGRYCCCGKMPIVREKLGSGFEEEEAWSCSEEVEYDAVITWNRPTPLFD
ncbi:hypothetical protein B0A48_00435 [Cryoendolithus antarcticus]|uniref:Uncharacterized protein n=1 Tax=Cryoendolithus antarcticus TaxID=1507870 RepID=A0A1V8TUQ7_9PEZI|nr:hypothetical protein B0A48_00435 [Cryoendolithus antarcticus]